MFKIPEKVKGVAKKYNLSLPKSKTDKTKDIWCVGNNFILKHDAVMQIAEVEKVIFYQPNVEVLKDEGKFYGVAMWGNGRVDVIQENGETKSKNVWTTADATRENVRGQGGYYFNMAEKRWQDRLTLKLLNLYEYGLYSSVEADEFSQNADFYIEASQYMKNNIRKIFSARGDYINAKAEPIMRTLSKADGQRVKDLMESGKIDLAVEEFYKLEKKEDENGN